MAQLSPHSRKRMLRQLIIKLLVIKRPTAWDKSVTLDTPCSFLECLVDEQCLSHTRSALLLTLNLNDKTEISKRNRERAEINRSACPLILPLGDKPNTRNSIERQDSTLYDLKLSVHPSSIGILQL